MPSSGVVLSAQVSFLLNNQQYDDCYQIENHRGLLSEAAAISPARNGIRVLNGGVGSGPAKKNCDVVDSVGDEGQEPMRVAVSGPGLIEYRSHVESCKQRG